MSSDEIWIPKYVVVGHGTHAIGILMLQRLFRNITETPSVSYPRGESKIATRIGELLDSVDAASKPIDCRPPIYHVNGATYKQLKESGCDLSMFAEDLRAPIQDGTKIYVPSRSSTIKKKKKKHH